MTASNDARQAIASAWGFAPGQPFYHEGMERLGDTLEVVMPDGRTVAQHLDDGEAAERRVLTAVRWAQHAPHHWECARWHRGGGPCTCGRDEVLDR